MSKNRVECVNCECFLREKTRRGNDFDNRMLCYNCYKEHGWNYHDLKRLFPEKVKEFFNNRIDQNSSSVINFGKYKGKEFNFVFENDKKYCKWIYDKSVDTDFSNNNFIKYLSNIYINDGTESTI